MKTALLVKMSSLGDVVHTLSAVNDAAAQGWRFDWVVEEAFADLPAMHPAVNRVIPIAWRRWRKDLANARGEFGAFVRALRSSEYDVVLDSQGLIKSAVVTLAGRSRATAGFSHTTAREPWAAFAYRRGIVVAKGQHAIERQRQLFAAALDYPLTGAAQTGLERERQQSREVLLLHGTTWETKHWPESMWTDLAARIKADGFVPQVTWGNDVERDRAGRILQGLSVPVLERQPLEQLTQRLRNMALVVGVDSGLLHLSAAMGLPTLGLYGPTDTTLTACRGLRAQTLSSSLACAPCVQPQCRYRGEPQLWQNQTVEPACFAQLTPERVWQTAKAMMKV